MSEKAATIQWVEEYDDNDNSYWEGPSPYHDEGSPILWRLRQSVVENKIYWYEDHDSELTSGEHDLFSSLVEAKNHCQKQHETIIDGLPESEVPGEKLGFLEEIVMSGYSRNAFLLGFRFGIGAVSQGDVLKGLVGEDDESSSACYMEHADISVRLLANEGHPTEENPGHIDLYLDNGKLQITPKASNYVEIRRTR